MMTKQEMEEFFGIKEDVEPYDKWQKIFSQWFEEEMKKEGVT
jgi:hypothetical protein